MERNIRPAVDADLAAVQEIVRAAYTHYMARMGREPGPMLDDYAALIAEAKVHVAERDGIMRGLVVLIPQEKAMLLDNVAVAPDAQGSGLGRLLLDFAEREAIQRGDRAITLYTNEAMLENIGLYERIGYVETHRVEEKGLRRIYMRKSLIDARS